MHDEPYEWRCPECRAMDRFWRVAPGGFQCQSCGFSEVGTGDGEQVAVAGTGETGAGCGHTEGTEPAPTWEER